MYHINECTQLLSKRAIDCLAKRTLLFKVYKNIAKLIGII